MVRPEVRGRRAGSSGRRRARPDRARHRRRLGTGIFVGHRRGHRRRWGPAVITVVHRWPRSRACFSALCDPADHEVVDPGSRAARTRTPYATLGELVAWIIGWDLILEYGVSSPRCRRLGRQPQRVPRAPFELRAAGRRSRPRDPRQAALELIEALRPVQQLAGDQLRPAVARAPRRPWLRGSTGRSAPSRQVSQSSAPARASSKSALSRSAARRRTVAAWPSAELPRPDRAGRPPLRRGADVWNAAIDRRRRGDRALHVDRGRRRRRAARARARLAGRGARRRPQRRWARGRRRRARGRLLALARRARGRPCAPIVAPGGR